MTVVAFLLAVAGAGLGGYALLVRIGFDDFDAWAGGRTAGLIAAAFPAWWAGVVGLTQWRALAVVLLLVLAALGAFTLVQRRPWRAVVTAELVFTIIALVILVIRLDHPQIVGQEKPMDAGIIATLLRSDGFPPLDMWLAGETLPYYYWGALLWTAPLVIGGLRLEIAYNLIVAIVGGLAGVTLWSLGRRLSGRHWGGLIAAFFGVLAGTVDAWRQLAKGTGIRHLDVWKSSRQHEDVITEFPLFTAWLGDLHPHYLSIPVVALAFLVAWRAGRDGPRILTTAVVAILFGVAWAANPWCMPPTLAGIALLILSGDGRWHWPNTEGRVRWLAVVAVAVGGWLFFAPFHRSFHPPFQGVKLVFAWTELSTLVLYGVVVLAPAIAAAVVLSRDAIGPPADRRTTALTLAGAAVVMVLAAASGRPSLVVLAAGTLALTWATLSRGERSERPAVGLAALGLFLFLAPELVYVVDSYGERLHRMNTVFKAYIQGWILLAVSMPVTLRLAFGHPWVRRVVTAVLVVAALPHLVWMGLNQVSDRPLGLDGIAWLSDGDRAVVEFLRQQPRGTTIVEAVGGAYTEYARFSAQTGVPAVLGWANHELVWRGHGVVDETNRRTELVNELYSCGDVERVREIVTELAADLVVIGALEIKDFDAAALNAVRAAGEVVLDQDGATVVSFGTRTEAGDG
jgi:YYY domain-containing protein